MKTEGRARLMVSCDEENKLGGHERNEEVKMMERGEKRQGITTTGRRGDQLKCETCRNQKPLMGLGSKKKLVARGNFLTDQARN